MAQKKPIWTTTIAHGRLKEYCAVTGRTQLEVVSELILTHLDPAHPERAMALVEEKPEKSASKKLGGDRAFGGVWVV